MGRINKKKNTITYYQYNIIMSICTLIISYKIYGNFNKTSMTH